MEQWVVAAPVSFSVLNGNDGELITHHQFAVAMGNGKECWAEPVVPVACILSSNTAAKACSNLSLKFDTDNWLDRWLILQAMEQC